MLYHLFSERFSFAKLVIVTSVGVGKSRMSLRVGGGRKVFFLLAANSWFSITRFLFVFAIILTLWATFLLKYWTDGPSISLPARCWGQRRVSQAELPKFLRWCQLSFSIATCCSAVSASWLRWVLLHFAGRFRDWAAYSSGLTDYPIVDTRTYVCYPSCLCP